MIIDTVRPIANAAGGTFWGRLTNCTSPTGTAAAFWQVLSDNDDNTWAQTGDPSPSNFLRVSCGTHTVPAGHERHGVRVRGRFRGHTIGGNQQIRVQRIRPDGTLVTSVTLNVNIPSPNCSTHERTSAYNNALTDAWISGGVPLFFTAYHVSGAICKLAEAFIDIDMRAAPTFVADVLDGAGTSQNGGVITDTSRPLFVFGDQELDGLPARSWRAAIYAQPTTVAPGFAPFVTKPIQLMTNPGPANTALFDPIPNGDYVIFGEISTTIRTTDPFVSNIESVAFSVDFPPPDAPANLTATVTDFPPSIEVCWEDPETGVAWDDPSGVVAELFRIDCNGTARIATLGDGLAACWVDRFFGLNPEPGCEPDDPCNIQYQVRYWGYSNGVLVTTEFTST